MDDNRIGQNIRKFRGFRLMKQKVLSIEVGISITYLSQIESGEREPSLKVLGKIAKALDVEMRHFFHTYTLKNLLEDK